MKLGLDLHGVIDSRPDFFAELTQLMLKEKHEVYIITGSMITTDLITELQGYGLVWNHIFSISDHHIKIGSEVTFDSKGNPWLESSLWDKTKSIYTKDEKVDFHIDDSDIYGKYFVTPYLRFYSDTWKIVWSYLGETGEYEITTAELFINWMNQFFETFKLEKRIQHTFEGVFGKTPLNERLNDILKQTISLTRFKDIGDLKEKTGDLLSSVVQLTNESNWEMDEVVNDTLAKINSRKDSYKSLSRKIRVAIYGGAFNPVTNGHVEVAKMILNSSKQIDTVWFLPAYQHLHNKQMEDSEHRVEMLNKALCDPRMEVFDYEIQHKFKGETYHFVKHLLSDPKYKDQYEFYFVIGQDNADTFDRWVNFEHLERMIPFIVVPRPGYKRDTSVTWYLKQPHIYLADECPLVNISSTEIRNWIKEEDTNIDKFVNPDVLSYINEQGLYSNG